MEAASPEIRQFKSLSETIIWNIEYGLFEHLDSFQVSLMFVEEELWELDISEFKSELRYKLNDLAREAWFIIKQKGSRRSFFFPTHSTLVNSSSSPDFDSSFRWSFQSLPSLPLPTFSVGYLECLEFRSFSTMLGINPFKSVIKKGEVPELLFAGIRPRNCSVVRIDGHKIQRCPASSHCLLCQFLIVVSHFFALVLLKKLGLLTQAN